MKDTYMSSREEVRDWRLAKFVTREQFEAAKRDGSGRAVIHGVPASGEYSEWREALDRGAEGSNESLSTSERTNILWTGISETTGSLYIACLNSQVFNQSGLHAAVSSARENDIAVRLKWDDEPGEIDLDWSPSDLEPRIMARLPKSMRRGLVSFVLPRPDREYTIVANYRQGGKTSEPIVVTPWPPKAPPWNPCTAKRSESGMTVFIRKDIFCEQHVQWSANGSFRQGCEGSNEAAHVTLTTEAGARVLKTWSDSSFGTTSYNGLSGSFVIEPGSQGRLELVRDASSCSDPAGPIGLDVTLTKTKGF